MVLTASSTLNKVLVITFFFDTLAELEFMCRDFLFDIKMKIKKSSQLYGMTSQFKLIADGLIFHLCGFFFNIGPSLIGLQAFYAQPSQCLNLFGELLICYHKLISYSPQFLQVSLPKKREIMSVKSHSVLVAILNTEPVSSNFVAPLI